MFNSHLRERPIGIFDSGIGGLTVLKKIVSLCPNENIVYFGDTARVPYGTKSAETILQYSRENVEFLLSHNVKMVVIACNTATAFALETLQKEYTTPIIGVIDAGAKKAVDTTINDKIAILATRGTITSNIYHTKIKQLNPFIQIYQQACPLFVPLVEEGFHEHPATMLLIKEYLDSLKKFDIDTILLGCTHYPFLQKSINVFFENKINIIDSASTCANQVKNLLIELDCHSLSLTYGSHHYYVSDSPDNFLAVGKKLLNLNLSAVNLHSNSSSQLSTIS